MCFPTPPIYLLCFISLRLPRKAIVSAPLHKSHCQNRLLQYLTFDCMDVTGGSHVTYILHLNLIN